MARVRSTNLARRGVEKNRRHDITRGIGGVHFSPSLARRFDRKLCRDDKGRRFWREPEVEESNA